MKFLSYFELKSVKGIPYTRRHLRDLCENDKFPKPVPISSARIGWIEEEVDAWLAQKVAQRGKTAEAPSQKRASVAAPRE